MRQANRFPGWIGASGIAVLFLLTGAVAGWTQDSTPPASAAQSDSTAAAVHELQEQVRELHAAVTEIRAEAAAYRAETADLRRELQATRTQLAAFAPPPSAASSPPADSTAGAAPDGTKPAAKTQPRSLLDRVAALEDSSQLLSDKVDEQYQTKVESASKYRARLSGMVLLNLFGNRGTTDNQDVPSYVIAPNPFYSSGNFGATMRQSEFGLEVFGPRLAGARTMGSLQADFAGGFPDTLNGVNSGLFRLRTASMRMDWEHTSIVAGQDNLFLSPLSPTSFASLAVPALSYAGDLWGWIPQIRVEHRFDLSADQNVTLQGGILDNLTGEPPYSDYGRTPQAGERSGQPGYGLRVSWTGKVFGQPLTLGTGGYYSRQNWGFDRHLDGWAGMTDWAIPLSPWASLSGEFYRGSGVGGLGGGLGRSVLFNGNPLDSASQVRSLDAIGGWSQLKIRASGKLEFNGAFGLDNSYAADLRAFPLSASYLDPTLGRNQGSLVNFIYRPRSNLLFSTEYRHLRTFHIDNDSYPASQVNLVMGILF